MSTIGSDKLVSPWTVDIAAGDVQDLASSLDMQGDVDYEFEAWFTTTSATARFDWQPDETSANQEYVASPSVNFTPSTGTINGGGAVSFTADDGFIIDEGEPIGSDFLVRGGIMQIPGAWRYVQWRMYTRLDGEVFRLVNRWDGVYKVTTPITKWRIHADEAGAIKSGSVLRLRRVTP